MSFKLNQLELNPDYDAWKDWQESFGKDYTRTGESYSLSGVKEHPVNVSFPLARESATAGVVLQEQVKELVKNKDVSSVYLNWSAATQHNGWYTLEDANISIPEGGIDAGFCEFSCGMKKVGEADRCMAAAQLNKTARTTAYGTASVNPQSSHGFGIGVSVFSKSGTFYNRAGSGGNIPVVQNGSNQDLFPYEQNAGSIGVGDVRVYDTLGGTVRANRQEIYGVEHKVIGDIEVENGLIRLRSNTGSVFGTTAPGTFDLSYYDGTQYSSAGTCSFIEDKSGSVDFGTTTPKISMNKVSFEESEVILTYPPQVNSLRLSLKVQRGRWDVTGKPTINTGAVHGSLASVMSLATTRGTVQADTSVTTATAAGTYAIATATKNYIVALDNATQFHAGMAKTATRANQDKFVVTGSKATTLYLATGSDYMSFFAVVPPTGQDAPADLGAQLLHDAKALPKVVRR